MGAVSPNAFGREGYGSKASIGCSSEVGDHLFARRAAESGGGHLDGEGGGHKVLHPHHGAFLDAFSMTDL